MQKYHRRFLRRDYISDRCNIIPEYYSPLLDSYMSSKRSFFRLVSIIIKCHCTQHQSILSFGIIINVTFICKKSRYIRIINNINNNMINNEQKSNEHFTSWQIFHFTRIFLYYFTILYYKKYYQQTRFTTYW